MNHLRRRAREVDGLLRRAYRLEVEGLLRAPHHDLARVDRDAVVRGAEDVVRVRGPRPNVDEVCVGDRTREGPPNDVEA